MSDQGCESAVTGDSDDPLARLGLPADLPEFLARFGSEAACREHLFRRRWPDGWRCARCGGDRHYRLATRAAIECAGCGAQQSLYAGTIFEQTKTPLKTWFLAIHLFLASKGGVSALELKRQLGFGSDQTAWSWLMKLRRAMGARDGPLEGTVEVGEAVFGGRENNKRVRGASGETPIAGGVEIRRESVVAPDVARLSGAARDRAEAMAARLAAAPETRRRLGRARLAIIGSAAARGRFVTTALAPTAAVAAGPPGSAPAGDRRWQGRRGGGRPSAVGLLFRLLERLLLGTYHGGVGRHLAAYLDEFQFRFDRKRLSPIGRTLAAIDRAVTTPPLTIRAILSRG